MATSEQQRYQVRFELGVAGAHAVGSDADVIIWADALAEPFDAPVSELPDAPGVVATNLASAVAVADWVLAEQVRLGRRFATTVIAAAGDRDGTDRFAVENFLVAGAVIDRLSSLGLDATSPEAAAAEAAYRTLGRAVGHLITASTSAVSSGEAIDSAALKVAADSTAVEISVLRSIRD
jgi:hypothetical protein